MHVCMDVEEQRESLTVFDLCKEPWTKGTPLLLEEGLYLLRPLHAEDKSLCCML